MRAIKPNNHRHSLRRTVSLTLVAVVIGGAGTVAALAALKVIDPEKLAFWREKEKPIPADWVAVPRCARPIERYTKVTAEYLTNPLTGGWFVTHLPPDKVPAGAIRDPKKILFRVTASEKKVGLFFAEADFLPLGSRPGIAGGTPEGKRAITLDASKLKGVHELREGDHVDLIASIPAEQLNAFGGWGGRPLVAARLAGHGENADKQPAEPRTVARDAVIVTPVTTRAKPIVSSSLTQGTSTRTVPVQEIVLAVGDEDIARVTKAMDGNLAITCVAHSGRPQTQDAEQSGPSVVAVPVPVRDIPAFSELTEADFRDPVTQRIHYESTSLTEINRRGIIPNVSDLVGRVVKRLMPIGRLVTESDLLPKGVPPGMTGGIEKDRQAMGIEADKIFGVENLRAGDRLDLLASFDLGHEDEKKVTEKLADGTVRVIESRAPAFRVTRLSSDASLGGRAEHWYVAVDAEVVVPLGTVVNPLAGAAPSGKKKPQVVISVERRDVPAMAQALAAKNIILMAAARSAPLAGKPIVPAGKVRVPAAPQGLPAFEPLTPESLRSVETRREAWRLIDARLVAEQQIVVDPKRLPGRILNKEKRQDDYFVEADFLPDWVRPGLAARVPAGKRAVVVRLVERESEEKSERSAYSETKTKTDRERTRIEGLEQVYDGRTSICSSADLSNLVNYVVRSVGNTLANRARVAPIVRDAVVVRRTMTEAVLAVDPSEVGPLEEALASRAGVLAVLYSGQSRELGEEPALSGFDGAGGARLIEVVIGDTRKVFVFEHGK